MTKTTLLERLDADYKTALKAGERVRVDTIRLVKAAAQRVAIEKRKDALEDAEVIQVLGQQAKQRRETIEAAQGGGRQDVLDQSTKELAVLESYLPKRLSEEELKRLIDEAMQSVGPQQGAIMKYVMSKAAGGADGKRVRELVGARLKQGS